MAKTKKRTWRCVVRRVSGVASCDKFARTMNQIATPYAHPLLHFKDRDP